MSGAVGPPSLGMQREDNEYGAMDEKGGGLVGKASRGRRHTSVRTLTPYSRPTPRRDGTGLITRGGGGGAAAAAEKLSDGDEYSGSVAGTIVLGAATGSDGGRTGRWVWGIGSKIKDLARSTAYLATGGRAFFGGRSEDGSQAPECSYGTSENKMVAAPLRQSAPPQAQERDDSRERRGNGDAQVADEQEDMALEDGRLDIETLLDHGTSKGITMEEFERITCLLRTRLVDTERVDGGRAVAVSETDFGARGREARLDEEERMRRDARLRLSDGRECERAAETSWQMTEREPDEPGGVGGSSSPIDIARSYIRERYGEQGGLEAAGPIVSSSSQQQLREQYGDGVGVGLRGGEGAAAEEEDERHVRRLSEEDERHVRRLVGPRVNGAAAEYGTNGILRRTIPRRTMSSVVDDRCMSPSPSYRTWGPSVSARSSYSRPSPYSLHTRWTPLRTPLSSFSTGAEQQLKRGSSAMDDDWVGVGGAMRRTRQKVRTRDGREEQAMAMVPALPGSASGGVGTMMTWTPRETPALRRLKQTTMADRNSRGMSLGRRAEAGRGGGTSHLLRDEGNSMSRASLAIAPTRTSETAKKILETLDVLVPSPKLASPSPLHSLDEGKRASGGKEDTPTPQAKGRSSSILLTPMHYRAVSKEIEQAGVDVDALAERESESGRMTTEAAFSLPVESMSAIAALHGGPGKVGSSGADVASATATPSPGFAARFLGGDEAKKGLGDGGPFSPADAKRLFNGGPRMSVNVPRAVVEAANTGPHTGATLKSGVKAAGRGGFRMSASFGTEDEDGEEEGKECGPQVFSPLAAEVAIKSARMLPEPFSSKLEAASSPFSALGSATLSASAAVFAGGATTTTSATSASCPSGFTFATPAHVESAQPLPLSMKKTMNSWTTTAGEKQQPGGKDGDVSARFEFATPGTTSERVDFAAAASGAEKQQKGMSMPAAPKYTFGSNAEGSPPSGIQRDFGSASGGVSLATYAAHTQPQSTPASVAAPASGVSTGVPSDLPGENNSSQQRSAIAQREMAEKDSSKSMSPSPGLSSSLVSFCKGHVDLNASSAASVSAVATAKESAFLPISAGANAPSIGGTFSSALASSVATAPISVTTPSDFKSSSATEQTEPLRRQGTSSSAAAVSAPLYEFGSATAVSSSPMTFGSIKPSQSEAGVGSTFALQSHKQDAPEFGRTQGPASTALPAPLFGVSVPTLSTSLSVKNSSVNLFTSAQTFGVQPTTLSAPAAAVGAAASAPATTGFKFPDSSVTTVFGGSGASAFATSSGTGSAGTSGTLFGSTGPSFAASGTGATFGSGFDVKSAVPQLPVAPPPAFTGFGETQLPMGAASSSSAFSFGGRTSLSAASEAASSPAFGFGVSSLTAGAASSSSAFAFGAAPNANAMPAQFVFGGAGSTSSSAVAGTSSAFTFTAAAQSAQASPAPALFGAKAVNASPASAFGGMAFGGAAMAFGGSGSATGSGVGVAPAATNESSIMEENMSDEPSSAVVPLSFPAAPIFGGAPATPAPSGPFVFGSQPSQPSSSPFMFNVQTPVAANPFANQNPFGGSSGLQGPSPGLHFGGNPPSGNPPVDFCAGAGDPAPRRIVKAKRPKGKRGPK